MYFSCFCFKLMIQMVDYQDWLRKKICKFWLIHGIFCRNLSELVNNVKCFSSKVTSNAIIVVRGSYSCSGCLFFIYFHKYYIEKYFRYIGIGNIFSIDQNNLLCIFGSLIFIHILLPRLIIFNSF